MTDGVGARGDQDPEIWFSEHFNDAADEIISFLGGDGHTFEGRIVADIGCGDGIIDLGLSIKGKPRKLVGYDPRPTDVDALQRAADAAGVAETLPECMSFATSQPDHVPVEDGTFDIVVTWSVFEHVMEPVRMMSEIERILAPGGVLFLQLWPFFDSEHGGHLWPHCDSPFPHLLHTDTEIRERLRGRRGTDPTRDAIEEFESLNRMTLDELQRAILAAGMVVTKLELITSAFHIPRQLSHRPLSLLGVGGVKLLAVAN